MSLLLRGGLVLAGLAGAFAAGFHLKPIPTTPIAAAQPPANPLVPKSAPHDFPINDTHLKPATVLGSPSEARPQPIDPLEAAGMEMIRKEMGIKTTILDKNEPVPAVLAAAKQATAPPDLPPVPRIGVESPPIAPVPMTGPTPRLDSPPVPAIPEIQMPPPPGLGVGETPAPASPLLVNTRAIALDFKVSKSGTSKVTAVELWTTRDGGATWVKTDRMTGCQSPFRTRLWSEGEYGFRMVFESESGMRTAEPKRGDRPDVRVELDTTPPRVKLSHPVAAFQSGKVRLSWQAGDPHLDSGFIRLEYSNDGKDWLPILVRADPKLPLISAFDWAPPAGTPPRVMIRVTARDTAGNYTTATSSDPVTIDLVAPEGKVTGVRMKETEVGPMPRIAVGRTGAVIGGAIAE
jgi:hypothetical protein